MHLLQMQTSAGYTLNINKTEHLYVFALGLLCREVFICV